MLMSYTSSSFPTDYVGTVLNNFCVNVVVNGNPVAVAKKWIPELMHYDPGVPIILVGTKLEHYHSYGGDEHQALCDNPSIWMQLPPLLGQGQGHGQTIHSPANNCTDAISCGVDIFLRSKMDEQGWVPVSLIATFNRVKRVTTNINNITDSTVIEIQVLMRRRNDRKRWVLPSANNQDGH